MVTSSVCGTNTWNWNSIVTYYLTVTNVGKGDARNSYMTDVVPKGLKYVPGSITAGGTYADGVITWQLGWRDTGRWGPQGYHQSRPSSYRTSKCCPRRFQDLLDGLARKNGTSTAAEGESDGGSSEGEPDGGSSEPPVTDGTENPDGSAGGNGDAQEPDGENPDNNQTPGDGNSDPVFFRTRL